MSCCCYCCFATYKIQSVHYWKDYYLMRCIEPSHVHFVQQNSPVNRPFLFVFFFIFIPCSVILWQLFYIISSLPQSHTQTHFNWIRNNSEKINVHYRKHFRHLIVCNAIGFVVENLSRDIFRSILRMRWCEACCTILLCHLPVQIWREEIEEIACVCVCVIYLWGNHSAKFIDTFHPFTIQAAINIGDKNGGKELDSLPAIQITAAKSQPITV